MSTWTFVVSANMHRRHLTAEKKWELIEALLKADPSTPDRQIAKAVNASPTYIGKVRKQAEKRGDVSTVDTRTDTKGRKQPARKPKAQPILPAVEIHEPQLDSVARNADFSDEPEAPTTNMVAPIKATLELMAQAAEAIVHFGTIAGKQFTDARDQFETEEAFDAWLAENKLGRDRVSALLVIGEHPDLARSIMTLIDEMLFNAFQRFTAEGQG